MMPADTELGIMRFILRFGLFRCLLIIGFRQSRHPKASPLFAATLVLSCALTFTLVPAIATSPLYIRNYGYQPLDEARSMKSVGLHTFIPTPCTKRAP
jgi:hypothetical protein